jgi:hypothetical protein
VARGGAIEMAVATESRPNMVWLVFLLFLFFSSFLSSASLERKEGREVRKKVSQEFNSVQVVLMRCRTQPSLSC